MSARPILFSGPMVRALLEGRKTQTRRVVKWPTWAGPNQEVFVRDLQGGRELWYCPDGERASKFCCPYGQPGDLLWVRETCSPDWADKPVYKADGGSAREAGYPAEPRWRPSIHMPRWASRLTLRITDVRVERLQDISDEDARDEGVNRQSRRVRAMSKFGQSKEAIDAMYLRACRWEYEALWEEINGPGSWDANPYVWALTFDVIKANVDQVSQ